MYIVQYEDVTGAKMVPSEAESQGALLAELATARRPILAVYLRGTPVTNRIRRDLFTWPGKLTRDAIDFAAAAFRSPGLRAP